MKRSGTAVAEVRKLDSDVEAVHDPVIMKHEDTHHVFSTGGGPERGITPIGANLVIESKELSGAAATLYSPCGRDRMPPAGRSTVVAGRSKKITGLYMDKRHDGDPGDHAHLARPWTHRQAVTPHFHRGLQGWMAARRSAAITTSRFDI